TTRPYRVPAVNSEALIVVPSTHIHHQPRDVQKSGHAIPTVPCPGTLPEIAPKPQCNKHPKNWSAHPKSGYYIFRGKADRVKSESIPLRLTCEHLFSNHCH